MTVCAEAFDNEITQEGRHRLASAALLFAQVAEHLERGSPLTPAIVAHCRQALSLVHVEVRRTIEVLLST